MSVLLKLLKIPFRCDINKKTLSLLWTSKILLTNQTSKITHWNQKCPSHTKIYVFSNNGTTENSHLCHLSYRSRRLY